jgi:hypothetical protein
MNGCGINLQNFAICNSPHQLDRARLLPMYEALHARTRAADNETAIFYALLAQAGQRRRGSGDYKKEKG